MRRRIWVLALSALSWIGCVTLRPEAATVRLTRDSKDVNGCREIGSVESWVAFSFRDAQNQLKNKASTAGGDTVLVTSTFGDDFGTAYDCRQPQPKK